MREIDVSRITDVVERLCIEANVHLPEDVKCAIRCSRACEDGSIAMGETLEKALTGVTILEKTAQIWIDVQALGSYVEISKEDCEFFHDFFKNKYGQKKG